MMRHAATLKLASMCDIHRNKRPPFDTGEKPPETKNGYNQTSCTPAQQLGIGNHLLPLCPLLQKR